MKKMLLGLCLADLALWVVGLSLYGAGVAGWEKSLGAGALFLIFILMPFFLYYRYDVKQKAREERRRRLNAGSHRL